MSVRGTLAWGRLLVLGLLLPALGAQAAQAQAGGGAADRVLIGIQRSADTVTVGDPFRIGVRVRAPLGSTIEFPTGPDSTAAVQLLDPMTPVATQDPAAVDQTATYRVAAWDVDSQRVVLGELIVRTPEGTRRVTLVDTVFVRSVLPADSAKRIPKPVRPVFSAEAPPSWWWLLVALAIAALLYLLWWWWRRRRRPKPVSPEDAYAHALEEFARVERLGLLDAGERGRYVALMMDVARDYLAARFPEATRSHTTTELLIALRGRPVVPYERLGAMLAEGDLVKFARRPVSVDRARQLGDEARAVVDVVEDAVRRAAEAERQAQAARAAAAREAA